MFVTNDNLAPWVLSSLVDEPLLESVMRPAKHGSGRFTPDSPVGSSDHPLGLENRQEDSVMLLNDPLDKLLVDFVNEVPNLLS